MVGGEQAKNKDLKEKHKRRKRYADERKKQLVAALQNSDEDSGDWVLLNVYDSIQEEVRAKSKLLEKMQKKVKPCLAPPPSPMTQLGINTPCKQLTNLCSSHKHLSACCVSVSLSSDAPEWGMVAKAGAVPVEEQCFVGLWVQEAFITCWEGGLCIVGQGSEG